MPKVSIWISHPQDAWIQAEVVLSDNDSVTVKGPKGDMKLPGDISNYDVVIPESVDKIADNLTDMEVFNEGVILHQVKQRYIGGLIYTFVGNILIALNPYQRLDIYGDELMGKIATAVKANRTATPHVFSIGATALHNMIHDNLDQSVLISGESGAGKTETTKKVLTYFSCMAGSTASRAGVSVESQILDSNPLLEGFGNAKTVRNNNSSRFGKWMEVNFDSRFAIKGCNIVSYLLEKTRVVTQMPSERNYHSFYMMLAGAPKEMRQEFSLKPPDQFNYLNQSGCFEIPGRSDAEEYEILIHSMEHLSLDHTIQKQIFQILAGILHLGNITFNPSRDTEGGSQIASGTECNKISSLLGVSKDALEQVCYVDTDMVITVSSFSNRFCSIQALCFKESTFGIGETITIPLDPPKAADQRDAFSKFIYGKLFDYIVYRVNNVLFRGRLARSIGVLDIFGFEVFKLNSFEQLCINYCNERLQSFFNDVIFANERQVYEEEGIDASNITFQDNVGCVRLIDQKNTGIFALLDEEVVVPRGSDVKFVSRLHTTFDESTSTKSPYFVRNRRKPNDFGVRHFAGDVMYTVDGFLEKNKDTLSTILITMLKNSSVAVISAMASIGEDDDVTGGGIPPRKSEAGLSRKSGKSEKLTLANKFKTDLDSLMTSLASTVPHFIRCVKPNDVQQPNKFDPVLALRQLKYAGLFEAIHIRKAGYAIRLPLDQFFARYKHCCLCTIKLKSRAGFDLVAICRMMLEELAPKIGIENPPTGTPLWVIGKTRVFLRTLKVKYALEDCRNSSVDFVALQIQRVMRGCVARSKLYTVRMEQNAAREMERKRVKDEIKLMNNEDENSKKLEQEYRTNGLLLQKMEEEKKKRMREEFERIRRIRYDAATRIQKRFRGRCGRIKAKTVKAEVKMERAISSRSESGLHEAIALLDALDVKPKHFKTTRQTAKDLLLEVEGEMYVKEQLEDAMAAASDVLLVSAIQLATDAGMVYLDELTRAKVALDNIRHRRQVLNHLRSLLNRCDTLPKLLASTDKLNSHIVQATSLGLGGEYLVQDTVMRIQRLKSLVDMRNKIRYAIEVCSVKKMKSSMDARNKLVRIYGPDLCSEEVAAVMNMMRMLSLAPTAAIEQEDEDSREDEDEDEDDEACADNGDSTQEQSDSLLPPFVCEQLDLLRSAHNPAEKLKAKEKLKLLVPNPQKLKVYNPFLEIRPDGQSQKYVRVFKWVVSFATWKYGMEAAHLYASEDPSESGDSTAAAGGLVKGYGYIPSPTRAPENVEQKVAISGVGDRSKTATPKRNVSLGSKIYRQRQNKGGGSDDVSGLTAGAEVQGGDNKCFIPFSQRQSKSAVAAYQAMKKRNKGGRGVPTSKAERMIADTLRDYNKFYEKHGKTETGWQT